jgi:ribonuclease P protein component
VTSAQFGTPDSAASGAFGPLSLQKSRRIVRSSEFRDTYKSGFRMTTRYFAAFCVRSESGTPARFGLTLPRALGKAVDRNRIRRRMRAAIAHSVDVLQTSWSVVFNPRRSVLDAPFEELCREVARVLTKCEQS